MLGFEDYTSQPKIKGHLISINTGIADEKHPPLPLKSHKNLQIPLRDFCAHIAKFEYNVNVSGYRMSIPSRFIESMMVGTAIITDRLKVNWSELAHDY